MILSYLFFFFEKNRTNFPTRNKIYSYLINKLAHFCCNFFKMKMKWIRISLLLFSHLLLLFTLSIQHTYLTNGNFPLCISLLFLSICLYLNRLFVIKFKSIFFCAESSSMYKYYRKRNNNNNKNRMFPYRNCEIGTHQIDSFISQNLVFVYFRIKIFLFFGTVCFLHLFLFIQECFFYLYDVFDKYNLRFRQMMHQSIYACVKRKLFERRRKTNGNDLT